MIRASAGRIIVSFPASSRGRLENIAERGNCPFTVIGHVGGDRLLIRLGKEEAISIDVSEMEIIWRSSLPKKLEAEVMAAGRE